MEKKINLNEFDAMGKALILNQSNVKADKKSLDLNRNAFSWLTLSILVNGTLQDKAHIASVFAKGNALHDLRMILSRGRTIHKALIEKGSVSIKETSFSMDQVKKATEPLFNVSAAYNALKAEQAPSLAPVKSLEERAIAAFCLGNEISVSQFDTQYGYDPEAKADCIAQGMVMVNAENDAVRLARVSDTIQLLESLKALDPQAFEEVANAVFFKDTDYVYSIAA